MIWKLQLSPSFAEQDQAFLVGPLTMMSQRLAATPKESWSQVVSEIDQQFGMPIVLMMLNSPGIKQHLSKEQQTKLNAGETILFYHRDELEYVYYRVPNSDQVLKIGKIIYPFLLVSLSYLIFLMLAILLGLVIWLWLRPVWQDLRKLQQASEGFGEGKLQTRIEVSKYSFIKTILHAFNGMANHIEQLIVSHKTLTNAVSHELRTPISRLRFSMEMLEKADTESKKTRYLQTMNIDIDELEALLAELLSYARLDRQSIQLDKSPAVLAQWLEQQTQRSQQECGAISISTSHTNLPSQAVTCLDKKLMSRALQNLLQNACRYAKQQIQVHFEYTNKGYQLSIDDDGCGIPQKYHKTLFDPFTRVDDSRDRDSGGYGLGLAIVKQIVVAHGGTIGIQASELGGSKFILSLPHC